MAAQKMKIAQIVNQSFGVVRIPTFGGRVLVRFPTDWWEKTGNRPRPVTAGPQMRWSTKR